MNPTVGVGGKCVGRGPGKSGPHMSETRCRAVQGEVTDPMLPRKPSLSVGTVPVPQTNSGGRVENTKAIEITVVKELGKIHP